MSSSSLPAAPSLEQLRKQAKELLRAHRAGDAGAVARVGAQHPHPEKPREAGRRAARRRPRARLPELGAAARLRRARRRARARPAARLPRGPRLLRGPGARPARLGQDGTPGAVAAFDATRRAAAPRPARAPSWRASTASQTWAALRRHVAGLRDSGEPFARAYRAVEAHDVGGLRAQLERFPELAAAVGTNGNDLLGMAGATRDERLVRVLLDARRRPGARQRARLDAAAPGGLLNLPLLAGMLLDAGVAGRRLGPRRRRHAARRRAVLGPSRDRRAARRARRAPRNLRVAAGLGR